MTIYQQRNYNTLNHLGKALYKYKIIIIIIFNVIIIIITIVVVVVVVLVVVVVVVVVAVVVRWPSLTFSKHFVIFFIFYCKDLFVKHVYHCYDILFERSVC